MRALALPPAEERRPGTALDRHRRRRDRPRRSGPLHRVWNVPEKGATTAITSWLSFVVLPSTGIGGSVLLVPVPLVDVLVVL